MAFVIGSETTMRARHLDQDRGSHLTISIPPSAQQSGIPDISANTDG